MLNHDRSADPRAPTANPRVKLDPIAQRHVDAGDRLTVRRNHRDAWVLDWDSPDGMTSVGVVGECDPQREFPTMIAAREWAIQRYGRGAHYSRG